MTPHGIHPRHVFQVFRRPELRDLRAMQVTAERFYMVGDNPTSDIEGTRRSNIFHRNSSTCDATPAKSRSALCSCLTPTSIAENNFRVPRGHHACRTWDGILVRTGVYKQGDETNGATAVVDGIADAVDWILEHEKTL